MVMGLAAVVVVALVGLVVRRVGRRRALAASLGLAWVGSVVFAAFGLFMGYLLPAENVMQILGPVLALLAFAGGLFVPLGEGLLRDDRQVHSHVRSRRAGARTPDRRRAEHLGHRQRGRLGRGVRRSAPPGGSVGTRRACDQHPDRPGRAAARLPWTP